jgi:hypothetical protein
MIKGYLLGMGVYFCITTIYIMKKNKGSIFSDDLEDRLIVNCGFSLIYPITIFLYINTKRKNIKYFNKN